MKKRTNKNFEAGTLGAVILETLKAHGFETSKTCLYPTIRFFGGYEGKLFARLHVYGDHASISFGGTGVKKDRSMDYYMDDMGKDGKFESRIKRLVRTARDINDRHERTVEREGNLFLKINQLLRVAGISNARQSEFGSNAVFEVNGYQLECSENLLIGMNVGGNRIKVDIATAVTLMESLQYNPNIEDDE